MTRKFVGHQILVFFLRHEIDRQLRIANQKAASGRDDTLEFAAISIRRGKSQIGLSNFAANYLPDDKQAHSIDLRGISIIKRQWSGIKVVGVNFDNATLDTCVFDKVTFIGCSFRNTSFRNVRLLGCHFDVTCVLSDNDFAKAIIDGNYDCAIIRPSISAMTYMDKWKLRNGFEGSYIGYTKILSKSFGAGIVQKTGEEVMEQ